MMRATICLCALVAGPAPLMAQDCPSTIADVAKGVTVTYADGTISLFKLDVASGNVVEDWTPPGGPAMRNYLDDGLHLTRVHEIAADGQTGTDGTYRFDSPLPKISGAGQVWEVGYSLSDPGQGEWKGVYSGTVGVEAKLQIGPCSYASFPVTMTMKEPEFTNYVQVDLVPSLGLSILRGYGPSLLEITGVTPVSIALTGQP